jgi:hypothetical protein
MESLGFEAGQFANVIGLPDVDIRVLAVSLIRVCLGFVGFIFVVQIMWSGFNLMTSAGEVKKEKMAHAGLKHAIIGLVLIVSSSSIAKFVIETLQNSGLGNTLGLGK